MAILLSVFLIGISFGLVLFLLASGLSLTMGLMRIVNMAHGALYMVGAYVGVAAAQYTGNFWIGILAGAISAGIIGMLLEIAFLRRLFKQEQSQVLLTIGFIYIITNIVQWIWGTYPLSVDVPKILSGSVLIGEITFPVFRFFIIGFGIVIAVLLWLFQEKTKIGAMVRAGMDNKEITGALGINLKVIFTGLFSLGSLVAGLCGLMGAQFTGIDLGIGWDALLFSLIVVIVGGTGSIQGALLGGILIGLLNSFGTAYFPSFAYFIIYVALILILLLRPSGLLGRAMQQQGPSDELPKASIGRKRKLSANQENAVHPANIKPGKRTILLNIVPYAAAVLLLAVLPLFISSYFQSMITKILIFAIFAMSLDLIMGYLGLPSFGHAAYLGCAGYFIGIMIVHFNISQLWIIIPLALLSTAILSAVIGYISLRVSGVYFLLVTMAFGQLLANVATKWMNMTGGTDGLVGIEKPDLGFTWSSLNYYYFVFIIFIVCFIILKRIVKSSFGKTLIGINQNETRMRSLGFNTWGLKYAIIIIGGFFAGVAGILFAYFYGTMVPGYLALETSSLPMLMVIIGGPGTLVGPCIGAAVIILVQQLSAVYIPERWPLLLGLIFVICVMLIRHGFAFYLNRFWNRINPEG